MDINPRLHSRTKALPILQKIKRTTTHLFFTQIPLLYYSFSLFIPPWGRCRSHPNSQAESFPNRESFPGDGKCAPFSCSLGGHPGFLSTFLPWIPVGLAWPMLAGGPVASLALDMGISFHRVPHIRVWPTQATWGFSSHTLGWVKSTIVWCSGPRREVTGLRQKRNHILSISAKNI